MSPASPPNDPQQGPSTTGVEQGVSTEQRAEPQFRPPTEKPTARLEPLDLDPVDHRLGRLRPRVFEEIARKLVRSIFPMAMFVGGGGFDKSDSDGGGRVVVLIRSGGALEGGELEALNQAALRFSAQPMLITASRQPVDQLVSRLIGNGVREPVVWNAEVLLQLLSEPEHADLARLLRGAQPLMGAPAYSTDAVPTDLSLVVDRLDRQREVDVLAALLASRDMTPPLSVGLLGDWGTGKSTYMALLEKEITRLAEHARTSGEADQTTCRTVAHVRFNAWHYSDTNLWASLVGYLFQRLAETMADPEASPDERRAALEQSIHNERGALAQEQRRMVAARGLVEEARKHTEDARAAMRLDHLMEGPAAAELQERAQRIGWGRAMEDAMQARGAMEAVQEGRWRFVLNGLGTHWGGPLRVFSLGVLVLLALSVAGWVTHPTDGVALLMAAFGASVQLGATIVAGARAVAEAGKPVDDFLQSVRGVLGQADLAVKKMDEVPATTLVQLDGWLASQDLKIAEREASLRALEAERASLDPSENLRRFIFDRAGSADYRERRGLVTLVREDLEALSARMRAYREGLRKGTSETEAARSAMEGTGSGSALRPLERIVLYIDDLDRCEPRQVVEVLQAIHLLLSFDLFVVVVAVDARWLLGSLRVVHRELFEVGQEGGPSVAPTTPIAYLEKIFQVPMALQPIDRQGFASLLHSMAAPPVKAGPAPEAAAPSAPGSVPEAGPDISPAPKPATDEPPAPPPTAQVLQMDPEELAFLETLYAFVPSPRAVKRLVNVYRIFRTLAGLEPSTPGSLADREAVLLLLTLGIGFPECTEAVDRWLLSAGAEDDLSLDLPEQPPEWAGGPTTPLAGWAHLRVVLATLPPGRASLRAETLQRWNKQAGRYSFRSATR